jgi:hypothetical protein
MGDDTYSTGGSSALKMHDMVCQCVIVDCLAGQCCHGHQQPAATMVCKWLPGIMQGDPPEVASVSRLGQWATTQQELFLVESVQSVVEQVQLCLLSPAASVVGLPATVIARAFLCMGAVLWWDGSIQASSRGWHCAAQLAQQQGRLVAMSCLVQQLGHATVTGD